MREDATNPQYTKAGVEADAAKKRKQFDIDRHGYIQLPTGFWTNGWALTLSGPGIAILLVLLIITQQGMKGDQWVIFATAPPSLTKQARPLCAAIRRMENSRGPIRTRRRLLLRNASRHELPSSAGHPVLGESDGALQCRPGRIDTIEMSPEASSR